MKEMEKNKETLWNHAKVAIGATCCVEICFLIVNSMMGVMGKYGSVAFEVRFHLLFMLMSFMTAFLSLWTYQAPNGPKRFLHLMMMSLPVSLVTMLLLIAPFEKGIPDALRGTFQPFWFLLWACSAAIPCLIGTIIIQKWKPKLLKWVLILLAVTASSSVLVSIILTR